LRVFAAKARRALPDDIAPAFDFVDDQLAGVLGVAGRMRAGRNGQALIDQPLRALGADSLRA
jgi:hypothetical protein